MRLLTSVLASVAILFAAASASASVSFSVTATTSAAGGLQDVSPGDTITLNIRISSTGTPIFGLGAAVENYRHIASFQSGNAVSGYLFEIAIPAVGAFNGLDNLSQGSLVENAAGFIQIANSAGLTGRTGTGATDPGLNGVVGGGDAQFRVALIVTAPGSAMITVGGNPALGNVAVLAGGATEAINNASIAINMIPEPGTALLMGLGLAGLAAAGRPWPHRLRRLRLESKEARRKPPSLFKTCANSNQRPIDPSCGWRLHLRSLHGSIEAINPFDDELRPVRPSCPAPDRPTSSIRAREP